MAGVTQKQLKNGVNFDLRVDGNGNLHVMDVSTDLKGLYRIMFDGHKILKHEMDDEYMIVELTNPHHPIPELTELRSLLKVYYEINMQQFKM